MAKKHAPTPAQESPEIKRCIDEQKRGLEYLEANGHDAPESKLARLGISDWTMEEVLVRHRQSEIAETA